MNTDTIANSNADDPTKALCSLSQNWWLFVLRGVLALIFAALAFWMPQSALLAMTILFGAFSLVNGALGLAAVQRHCRHTYGRRRPGCSLGRHDSLGFFFMG